MKTNIYYFSGTGNSLKIALDLAGKLENADVISMVKAMHSGIDLSVERIGLVFPVYMYRIPYIVVDFIKKIRTERYIFAVVTCGGDYGDILIRIRRLLKSNGSELSAGFGVRMPSNYIPFGEALPNDEQQEIFSNAGGKIKEIINIVNARKNHFDSRSSLYKTLIHPGLLYRLGYSFIPKTDKDFWSDEKCTGCEICKNICPENNITILDGKPKWNHHCQQCFACLQWCPEEAIQMGQKTVGRKRYHHPEIRVKDIMAQKES